MAQDDVHDNAPECTVLSPQALNDHATIPSTIASTPSSPATSSAITQDEFNKVTGENSHLNHRVTELDHQLQHLLSQLSAPNATSLQPQSSQTTVSSTTSTPFLLLKR